MIVVFQTLYNIDLEMKSAQVTQLITHLAAYQAKYEALKYENTKLHELILTLTGVDLRIQSLNAPIIDSNKVDASPRTTESWPLSSNRKPTKKRQGRLVFK